MNNTIELQLDGLVGPTHNYAGLASGNIASASNKHLTSNPRTAALQGLEKARTVASLGIPQAILPPHPRPFLPLLHEHQFTGDIYSSVRQAFDQAPHILAAAYSASPMWAANAATHSPSPDTPDHKLHFTPANLNSNLHRSIEHHYTANLLQQIFHDPSHFKHHHTLPHHLPDEGAANHTRLCPTYNASGLHLFTFGKQSPDHHPSHETISPIPEGDGRQLRAASYAIAQQHHLDAHNTFYLQQAPRAVSAGVFHNDVIAVGNRNLYLYHSTAYVGAQHTLLLIKDRFQTLHEVPLHLVEIHEEDLPLEDAVATYLFNSQLLTPPSTPDSQHLLCPAEVREHTKAWSVVQKLLENEYLSDVHIVDVRQSMMNGGGPACLRLRVTLTPDQLAAMHQPAILTEELYLILRDIIQTYYRDELSPPDLADPDLIIESQTALEKIYAALQLNLPTQPLSPD
ncbi:N-succinylarginine dihydrolase [Poriferisphaera sp. WC338]|uniref:N-succinylarginine dihydrolase n=1 Tax=Poriferisphaera sp. WC338 TaxID=3425129 RepID=UPI003D8178F4